MPEKENMIIGKNPVREALRSEQPIDMIYINHANGLGEIMKLAKEKNIVIKTVSEQKLSQIAEGGVHQGVIAFGACAGYVTVDDLLAVSQKKGTKPFLIICDEIEDPHNLGAIIRTAETAGADGVIIPKRRSAMLTPTVYKTSAGAVNWLPVARVSNLGATIDRLKKENIWIYGTDMNGSVYTETDFGGAVALVIGSEGFGMSRLIKEKCDFLVKLPMFGKITSLNASVAAGIFMYEVVRQKMLTGK
ncbi:MAG: 23S rRNA (guanosine(2251)-2'-O)-methyltransferase RlmB [Oscillospiraceae bacterium]|nr:23S rRNA (guanosine(2251)-2'-O)-methyltransferase RlmB [Ruminococcus sp.]MDE6708620.1 23S rRNA (guanosine(2251)-2'-O)-methyltransferase RlmB [Oscillospiraceae bacterium]